MPDNAHIWIGDSAYHTLRLLLRCKVEHAMNRGNHKIQTRQYVIRVIECTVSQDITFRAFQNVQATGELLVQVVNLIALAEQIVLAQTTGIGSNLAVVSDTKIGITTFDTSFRH